MNKKLKQILCGFIASAMMASCFTGVAYAQEVDENSITATPETAESIVEPENNTEPVEEVAPEETEEAAETSEPEATPETAATTSISVSVVDDSFVESDERINCELFNVGDVEATMPYGRPVPLYFQISQPEDGGHTEITLDGDARFVTSNGEATDEARHFVSRDYADTECSAWMLYVEADSDFSATMTYTAGDNTISKKASVTMQDVPMLMAAEVRSSEQYHITGVDNVGGEWLITFEGESNSYCMDKGLNGKPTSSVYWTFYGTTDLLEKAAQAGCTTKNEIQQYVWDHRQEASNSGSSYVYAASEAGWQNVVTTFGHGGVTGPDPTAEPTYGASWSVDVTESASAGFVVTMTIGVDKYANVTQEKLTDAEITVSAAEPTGTIDGGDFSIDPSSKIIRTINGDGSATFTYKGTVSKSSSRSDGGSVSNYPSQSEADGAASAARADAENRLRGEAQADAQAQANAAVTAAAQIARQFVLAETGIPYGFSATGDSNQTQTVQPNGSAVASIANQPWKATVKWEKLDAVTGGRLTEDTEFVLYEWNVKKNAYAESGNYKVIRLADGTYTVRVTNPAYKDWTEGCLYFTQQNIGKFKIAEKTAAYGYTMNTSNGATPWTVEFSIDEANKKIQYLGANADRNVPEGNKILVQKVDSETGKAIAGNAVFSLYEWNQSRGLYEISTNYAVVRDKDGSYTIKCLHSNWKLAEYGNLYFEDTLCDTRENTKNSDGTSSSHKKYYTDYDMGNYGNSRSYTNDGQFLIVEHQAPDGYYGDWTDINNPGDAGTDLGKRAYYIRLTGDGSTIVLGNADYNADIAQEDNGSTRIETANGIVTVKISRTTKKADRTYATDSSGLAANENSRTVKANGEVLKNDRVLGEITLTKVDLDAMKYLEAGSNGETTLEGAVYDLYAAEDIKHPDGVTGTVEYSKITDNGAPIWHTTVKTNGGWDTSYLPVLQKDHLVASAAIKDGKLVLANLYLGRYYLVERATGLVLMQDDAGKFYVNGQYPLLNKKLEATGSYNPLATSNGEYTDYVYMNQYSAVAEGRALNGSKTYDGYYLSFATGYLCDEVNHYEPLTYGGESTYVNRLEQESQDEVLKGGFSLNKLVSTTGQPSPAVKLEGAGFTIYRIADLSKAAEFKKSADGSYDVQSIYDAYRKDNYDESTKKYDFTAETAAIVSMYEGNTAMVQAYNASITADGDNANGSGKGWQPTNEDDQYKFTEIFSNEEGVLRVEGLPYGQYLVVETTIPKDVFQADPFMVTINAAAPQGSFSKPAGSVTTASNSYQTYNILDEELEGYLQLIKLDAETGKAVKIANASFSIYAIHDGKETLVEMNDPASSNATKKVSVFYTDENGQMKTPEKLPLGKYRVVEIEGPEGFFNDQQFSVEFELTSERVWQVVGNSADDMDDYIITENYANHETLGKLTIRKIGEVLTGYKNGQFTYETDALAGAEYGIYSKEDIATADRQGTLWYAKGDLVATITTGADGQIDTANFAPTRTQATYDFLSVIHDGTKGEVSITLPLGDYEIHETKAPYGYASTDTSYSVSFTWSDQHEQLVLADETFVFENDRIVAVPDEPSRVGVGIYKQDAESKKYLAGASYALYSTDDIFDINGNKLVDAGTLLATTGPTDKNGFAWFTVDAPIRNPEIGNSGNYNIAEIVAPAGYLLDSTPLPVSFTYPGQEIKYQVVDNTNKNIPTKVEISKRDLTNGNELPGAILAITDAEGNEVTKWGSTNTQHTIRGLELGKEYTLTELRAAQGYALAENIVFKLEQATAEDGELLQENEVYYKDSNGEWQQLDDQTIIMNDDITRVEISKTDITTGKELPGAALIITDTHGEEITRWETGDTPHYIEKLPAGDYILTEVTAPEGFAIAESVPFTVQPTGEIQHVLMKDALKLTVRKTDLGGNELEGATITVRDAHGNVVETWVSTKAPHEMKVTGEGDTLPDALILSGENEHVYNMVENTAPAGYEIATTIQFMLRRDNDGKVLVYTRSQPTDAWKSTDSSILTMVDKPAPAPAQPTPTPKQEEPTPSPVPVFAIPQTGDQSNPMFWVFIFIASGCTAAGLFYLRNRK